MQILEGGYNSDNSGTISRRQNRKHVSSSLLSLEQTYSHNLVILSWYSLIYANSGGGVQFGQFKEKVTTPDASLFQKVKNHWEDPRKKIQVEK